MQWELTHLGSMGSEGFGVCGNADGSSFPVWHHIILSQLLWALPSFSKTRDWDSRTPGLSQGFLCSCWFSVVCTTLSLTLIFFLFGGLQMILSSQSRHLGVQMGNCMEMGDRKSYLLLYLLSQKEDKRRKLNRRQAIRFETWESLF